MEVVTTVKYGAVYYGLKSLSRGTRCVINENQRVARSTEMLATLQNKRGSKGDVDE